MRVTLGNIYYADVSELLFASHLAHWLPRGPLVPYTHPIPPPNFLSLRLKAYHNTWVYKLIIKIIKTRSFLRIHKLRIKMYNGTNKMMSEILKIKVKITHGRNKIKFKIFFSK